MLAVLMRPAAGDEFPGWQTMRVIGQEGEARRMIAADLSAQKRDDLVVVNTRQSRLEIYSWRPVGKREPPAPRDAERPNELPMAPEWAREEVPLDDLPVEVAAERFEGQQGLSLVVLAAPSNKVLLLQREGEAWKKTQSWDLLPGSIESRDRNLMLIRRNAAGKPEALITCEQGIQTLVLEPGSRAAWLTPRETRGRNNWWLADIDGDGKLDLVEWSSQTRQSIRWYENANGGFRPAQAIYDQPVQGADLIDLRNTGKPAELLVLGGTQEGLLRRYVMGKGKESPLGRRQALPMPGGNAAVWCGVTLDGKPALAAVDAAQPRLRLVALTDAGWQAEQNFPIVGNVKAMVAPQAQPGTLLLWVKEAADLHVSKWEAGRLTYPKPMVKSAEVEDRRILALDSVGKTTWWVQRVGEHLTLYTWAPGQDEPKATRFEGAGAKAEKVVWLGGERLLVQQAYSTAAKLVSLKDGKPVIAEPAHLAKAELGEFDLIEQDGKLRTVRRTDGVLQWLGEDLQPVDQTMLGEGQKLLSYTPLPDGEAWALEEGGRFVHRMKPDKAGVLRVADSVKLPGGSALVPDAVLGLMLVDQDRVTRLSPGEPRELKLVDSIDSRVGRPSGVKEATIHRFFVTDAMEKGVPAVLLCDDRRHHLTLLARTDKSLKAEISWPVFDDKAYPYGERGGPGATTEPRAIIALDADGDGHRDLAMLCQDRLLIYLARSNP